MKGAASVANHTGMYTCARTSSNSMALAHDAPDRSEGASAPASRSCLSRSSSSATLARSPRSSAATWARLTSPIECRRSPFSRSANTALHGPAATSSESPEVPATANSVPALTSTPGTRTVALTVSRSDGALARSSPPHAASAATPTRGTAAGATEPGMVASATTISRSLRWRRRQPIGTRCATEVGRSCPTSSHSQQRPWGLTLLLQQYEAMQAPFGATFSKL